MTNISHPRRHHHPQQQRPGPAHAPFSSPRSRLRALEPYPRPPAEGPTADRAPSLPGRTRPDRPHPILGTTPHPERPRIPPAWPRRLSTPRRCPRSNDRDLPPAGRALAALPPQHRWTVDRAHRRQARPPGARQLSRSLGRRRDQQPPSLPRRQPARRSCNRRPARNVDRTALRHRSQDDRQPPNRAKPGPPRTHPPPARRCRISPKPRGRRTAPRRRPTAGNSERTRTRRRPEPADSLDPERAGVPWQPNRQLPVRPAPFPPRTNTPTPRRGNAANGPIEREPAMSLSRPRQRDWPEGPSMTDNIEAMRPQVDQTS